MAPSDASRKRGQSLRQELTSLLSESPSLTDIPVCTPPAPTMAARVSVILANLDERINELDIQLGVLVFTSEELEIQLHEVDTLGSAPERCERATLIRRLEQTAREIFDLLKQRSTIYERKQKVVREEVMRG